MFDPSSDWGADEDAEALNQKLFGGKVTPNLKKLEKKLKRKGMLGGYESEQPSAKKKKQDSDHGLDAEATTNGSKKKSKKKKKKTESKDVQSLQLEKTELSPAKKTQNPVAPSEVEMRENKESGVKPAKKKNKLPKDDSSGVKYAKKLKQKKKKKQVESIQQTDIKKSDKKSKNKYKHLAGLSKGEKREGFYSIATALATTEASESPSVKDVQKPLPREKDKTPKKDVTPKKLSKVNANPRKVEVVEAPVSKTSKKSTDKTTDNKVLIRNSNTPPKDGKGKVTSPSPALTTASSTADENLESKVPGKKKKKRKGDSAQSEANVSMATTPQPAANVSPGKSGISALNRKKLAQLLSKAEAEKKLRSQQQQEKEEEEREVKQPQRRPLTLREKMEEKLNSARFRYLNEQLYTQSSKDAVELFKGDPEAFKVYHEGFQSQVTKWPVNPVDKVIQFIKERPASDVVADFGCGEAKVARSVGNKVHSFDLAAANKHVTVCDIAKVPLGPSTVDIGVFCLSLMGTNLVDFVCEANRVIKNGGILLVAEVVSRFEKVGAFVRKMEKLGFSLDSKDTSNKMFVWFEFHKSGKPDRQRLPQIELGPCIYKRR